MLRMQGWQPPEQKKPRPMIQQRRSEQRGPTRRRQQRPMIGLVETLQQQQRSVGVVWGREGRRSATTRKYFASRPSSSHLNARAGDRRD